MCSSGLGWGRKQIDPHPIKFQKEYNDYSRGLRGIKLTYQQAKAAYTCRYCNQWQGCSVCVGDIAELICKRCRDWANDISEQVHGAIDPEKVKP